jgi:hypothetical protein
MALVEARPGALVIAARLDHVKAPAPLLRAERPCADLSPAMASYDPLEAFPGASSGETAELRPGSTIRLAPAPGGARTIEIATGPRQAEVVGVLASAGGERRIAYDEDQLLVVGWVPAAELGPAHATVARDGAPEQAARGIGKQRLGGVVRCGRDLDLYVALGGALRRIGLVRRETPIDVGGPRGGYAVIELPEATMTTAPEATLLVSRAVLASCSPPRALTGS